jgi:hypothetical protein
MLVESSSSGLLVESSSSGLLVESSSSRLLVESSSGLLVDKPSVHRRLLVDKASSSVCCRRVDKASSSVRCRRVDKASSISYRLLETTSKSTSSRPVKMISS